MKLVPQSEEYIAECFLDYDYIKSDYRFIAVNSDRKKELDADPNSGNGQLKNADCVSDDGAQFIFVLKILGKKLKI